MEPRPCRSAVGGRGSVVTTDFRRICVMSNATVDSSAAPASGLARVDLFLISWLILFLELACIRWFPSHVLFLTFFTNTVLLACFLGMSLGCLAASHPRNYLRWTPSLLLLSLPAALKVA